MSKFKLCSVLLSACAFESAASADVPVAISPVRQIVIDGSGDDWGDAGLHLDLLTAPMGGVFPTDDLSATARVGYDEQALYVLVRIRDDSRDVAPDGSPLSRGDSVEFFVSDAPGSLNRYQLAISPAVAGKPVRVIANDRREPSPLGVAGLKYDIKLVDVPGGYVVEARLPWSNLGRSFQLGDTVGFQLRINDKATLPRKCLVWYPSIETYRDPDAMVPLTLAQTASPVRVRAIPVVDRDLSWMRFNVVAVRELVGKPFDIVADGKSIFRGKLVDGTTRAVAEVKLPVPAKGQDFAAMQVNVEGEPAQAINLPDVDDARAYAMVRSLRLAISPAIFADAQFPTIDFANPLAARLVLGNYDVHTTFYDANYNVVAQPKTLGRFGAVIEFVPQDGSRPVRRFRTLVRVKPSESLWYTPSQLKLTDAKLIGLDPSTAAADADEISATFFNELAGLDSIDSALPALLAGLREPTPATQPWRYNDNAAAKDRQWWLGLKRNLNGWDKAWPDPLIAPRAKAGLAVPVLHEDSLEKAELSADGIADIDRVCQKWAADSDEGFTVLIARHGVIALHKSYGQRNGGPMTNDTKSSMASITKTLAGSAMMIAVDQGRVGLNDPLGKFFPAMAKEKVAKPATVLHLYTHTAGLTGGFGATMHDLDEAVGEYYPHMKVGRRYLYSGTSYEMGGKILEAVSGEALPQFYLHHLLTPLGMDHTDVGDSGGGMETTAADLARLSQMLLNRGAYGNQRFFSEATFQQMLPRSLAPLVGDNANGSYGIGVNPFGDCPLGSQTIGHGAASDSILRISPEQDMIVVQTRDRAGKNYGLYYSQFWDAVPKALIHPATTRPSTEPPAF